MAELDLAEREGHLVPADEIEPAWTAIATPHQDAASCHPVSDCCACTRRPSWTIFKLATDFIHEALEELSQTEIVMAEPGDAAEAA